MRTKRPGLPRRGSSGSSGCETLARDLHGAVAGLPEILSQSSLSKKTLRHWIFEAIPQGRKLAIVAEIGLLLWVIALRNADIIQASEATLVTAGELMTPGPVLFLLGFCTIVALSARRVPGAAIIGMLGVAGAGLALGVSEWQGIVSLPPDPTPTLLALDIAGALQASMIAVILAFLMVDLFDTTGTLIGVAHQAQLLDESGRLPGMQRALIPNSRDTDSRSSPRSRRSTVARLRRAENRPLRSRSAAAPVALRALSAAVDSSTYFLISTLLLRELSRNQVSKKTLGRRTHAIVLPGRTTRPVSFAEPMVPARDRRSRR